MFQYIITPIVAAAVGYFTNDLAIKMLFRPHTAKYVWGYKLPFTPGLIPKERTRIAKSLGASISENLMNQEVLAETLLCDEMVGKVEGTVADWLVKLQQEETPLRQYLAKMLPKDEVERMQESATSGIAQKVGSKLIHSNLGQKIAHLAVEHAIAKMNEGISGFLGAGKLLNLLRNPAESLLQRNIDEMLESQGLTMVDEMVSDSMSDLFNTPVKDLLALDESKCRTICNAAVHLYRTTIEQQLPRVLEALNIPQIIESRINAMDISEMEQMIMSIMKRELRAIVWLGALLGFVIGCINCLFI